MTAPAASLKATSMSVGLTADDLERSIRFYEGLGFEVERRWEQEGVLHGVMVKAGECRIGLSQDDWKKGRNRVKGVGMRIWIGGVQNLDQLAARAKAAGINLDAEPHETPWGSRVFEVTDPDGLKLTVSAEG